MYSDVSDGDLVRALHGKFYSDMPYGEFLKHIDFRPPASNPTGEISGLDKFNAGMGLAFTNIGRAGKQMVGMDSDFQRNRAEDKALTNTGAGLAGNVAGNIAAFAPLALVPGANTVAGAGAIGGITGALQPTDTAGERLKNMAIGGVLGSGTQYAATTGAQKIGEAAASRQAEAAARQSRNSVRDETLRRAQEAGYVVPPSAVNPSTTNKVVESVAGKAAVGQEAALRNQDITDALARRAAGLSENVPITESALAGVRKTAAQPYRDVAGLSQQASADLESLKQARNDATAYFKHYERSADPSSLAKAKQLTQTAEQLEQNIEQAANASGRPDLIDALRQARKQIAKTYTVERALNVGSGNVDARAIGRALDKGAPLSDDLETIGRFAEAFSPYAREGSSIPTPGVSKVAALASMLMGGGGAAAAGPVGVAAGAVPFVVPPAARSMVLSKHYQSMMAKPDYSVSSFTKNAAALADPQTRERLALLGRALVAPSIPLVTQQQ